MNTDSTHSSPENGGRLYAQNISNPAHVHAEMKALSTVNHLEILKYVTYSYFFIKLDMEAMNNICLYLLTSVSNQSS
jgi:hypothetical protein